MNFLDIAQSRYTTKVYDSAKQIPQEQIEKLKEVLRLSPSSINSQPWQFFFISDKETKKKLAEVSYFNEHKINDSSLLVVFAAMDDIDKFEIHVKRDLPEGAVAYYNNNIKSLPEATVRSWMQNQVYLSLGFFLSACATMGIDSTPMEGIQQKEYDKILKLNGYKTLFAVALGYRKSDDSNQPSITPKSRLNADDVIVSI